DAVEEKQHVVEVASVAALQPVHGEGINLGLVHRSADVDITLFLQSLVSRMSIEQKVIGDAAVEPLAFEVNETVMPKDVRAVMSKRLHAFKSLAPAGYRKLLDDVASVAADFARLTGEDELRLWFGIVRTDSCKTFHRDYYHLRLLCTYLGAGTEWLENDNVNRAMLAKGENLSIAKELSRVKQLQPFQIAVLKGEYGDGNAGNGLIHRSPAAGTTGEARVLLRIDTCYRERR
ncbi:MAG: DUF1826 domain-containing protein, partial [Rhizobacter sp.]|nr:DUF1826 domain-containing protein [Chlorobiales bacterium]